MSKMSDLDIIIQQIKNQAYADHLKIIEMQKQLQKQAVHINRLLNTLKDDGK